MKTITLAIECDASVSDELTKQLQTVTESEIVSAKKNSLDGSMETVLQVVQVVASLASTVTPLLALYLGQRSIKKIKLGPVEIENPTQEEWDHAWKKYMEQGNAKSDSPE